MSDILLIKRRFTILGSVALLVMSVAVAPAEAASKIKCNGPWQVIKSAGKIATPYCGDGYLARVARGYGVKVSANAIRRNPNRKREVCQFIGHDIRVSEICAGFDADVDHGRR